MPPHARRKIHSALGAFTRSVPIRFSHCDPAGIVYFPHYFDMFNGVIEDWYKDELKHDYAALVMGERFGFPFVHIECDFKIPSLMGDVIELTFWSIASAARRSASSSSATATGSCGCAPAWSPP